MEEKGTHAGHRSRIKKRFLEKGITALDEKALIELILTYSIPRRDVYDISAELVHKYGSADGVLSASVRELVEEDHLSEHTALLFKLINDIRTKPYQPLVFQREKLSSVMRAAEYCHSLLSKYPVEAVVVLCMDEDDYVMDMTKVSHGSDDAAAMPIEEIIMCVRRQKAKRVLLAHNHPSGRSTPSSADVIATEALRGALYSNGIELVEHIVVSRDECTAMLHHQTIPINDGRMIAPWM